MGRQSEAYTELRSLTITSREEEFQWLPGVTMVLKMVGYAYCYLVVYSSKFTNYF